MSVPFVDTTREILEDLPAYETAVRRVLQSGIFVLGPEITAFEESFAALLQVKHVVTVSNGTLALYVALLALEIGSGDEVLVPTNSFIATAEAVVMTGARPVFCDVDPKTHHLSLTHARELCTDATKAIIPVHLYGRMVDMEPVEAFAKERGIRVIEDACQAHGAHIAGRYAGTIGDLGCFSFYPTKNLGALGEGGAVVTNNDELAEKVRSIRAHGTYKDKYRHERFGINARMEALQGAFLSLKLKNLASGNVRRQAIADRYRTALKDLPIGLPDIALPDQHVYHLFVVTVEHRESVQSHLETLGVHSAIHYPVPIHLQPSMPSYSKGVGSCPEAERLAGKILSLPLFSTMTDLEVDEVVAAVRSGLRV